MILTTADSIPGNKIEKSLGIVRGSIVQTKNIGRDILAGLKTIIGGEISDYTKLMEEARAIAVERMVEDAENLGANAIINVRFATSNVMNSAAEILVYGTAVRLEKK